MPEEPNLNSRTIEQIEYKYLNLLNNSLGNSTQLKKELESQNKFFSQFMNPTDRASLKFKKKNYLAAGAERVIFNSINKSGFFGTPNSSPIGGDLFFETKDDEHNQNLLISIDCKTVRAETNMNDIHNFDVGLNQHSYKSTSIYDRGVVRLINPILQTEYKNEHDQKCLLLSYLVVILYHISPSVEHPEKTEILMISSFCIPNGQLVNHYHSRPWAGGKSRKIKGAGNQILKKADGNDYVTLDEENYVNTRRNLGGLSKRIIEEEFKNRTGNYLEFTNLKSRVNYKEIQKFEIFDGSKERLKIIYLSPQIPNEYSEDLKFFKDNYSI